MGAARKIPQFLKRFCSPDRFPDAPRAVLIFRYFEKLVRRALETGEVAEVIEEARSQQALTLVAYNFGELGRKIPLEDAAEAANTVTGQDVLREIHSEFGDLDRDELGVIMLSHGIDYLFEADRVGLEWLIRNAVMDTTDVPPEFYDVVRSGLEAAALSWLSMIALYIILDERRDNPESWSCFTDLTDEFEEAAAERLAWLNRLGGRAR